MMSSCHHSNPGLDKLLTDQTALNKPHRHLVKLTRWSDENFQPQAGLSPVLSDRGGCGNN